MIGNQLAAGIGSIAIANDSFNGTGSATVFTLSQTVSAVTDIEVLVDNVQQSPYDSSYSVSGTTLTFSAAPAAGTNNIYVIYNHARTITTNQVVPDDGSVVAAKLGAAAVTTAKLHDDAVTHAKLPSGSVLQMVNAENTTGVALQSNATIKIMDCQIVTKMANSSFIVHAFCSIGTYNSLTGNTDTDVALALGYKSGAADASSGNYIGIGSYSPTRHFVSFSNGNRAFYSIDAFAGAHSYNYVYHAFAEPSTVQSFSPSVAAGTTLQVGLFGASDVNQTNLLFGTRRPDNGADSGTITYVCVTEISP